MANLNEYCLYYIFEYLGPHEWTQISQVCRFWKVVVSRHWKKINQIVSLERHLKKTENRENAQLIQAKDAEKIALRAVPFVTVLSMNINPETPKKMTEVMFGSYLYKVDNFDSERMLNLLGTKAKKRKKSDHFLILKELNIDITAADVDKNPTTFLSPVFQYFREITSLSLHWNVKTTERLYVSYKVFSFIGKLSNIEKFDLRITGIFVPDICEITLTGFLAACKKLEGVSIGRDWKNAPRSWIHISHLLPLTIRGYSNNNDLMRRGLIAEG